MASIRRVVLDILKPHDPSLPRFTSTVASVDGVEAATATLVEMDKEVQNILLAVEGDDLDLEAIESTVTDLGATVHSIDQVAVGDRIPRAGTGHSESRVFEADRP